MDFFQFLMRQVEEQSHNQDDDAKNDRDQAVPQADTVDGGLGHGLSVEALGVQDQTKAHAGKGSGQLHDEGQGGV